MIRFIKLASIFGLLHFAITILIFVSGVGEMFGAFNKDTSNSLHLIEVIQAVWNFGAFGAEKLFSAFSGAPLSSLSHNLLLPAWSLCVGLIIASIKTIRRNGG